MYNDIKEEDNNKQQNQPQQNSSASGSYAEKNPDEWITGSEQKPGSEASQDKAGKSARENLKTENSPKTDEKALGSNAEKDPDEWITGAEPMTGAQKSYLKTLSDEAGEAFNENLSKAEASKRIEELQQKTGRGLNNNSTS